MKKILCLLVFCAGFVFSGQSFAGIRLPAVISSNMVLQQQSGVTLWGWADPAEKIVVSTSWNNGRDSVVADTKRNLENSNQYSGGGWTLYDHLKGWNTIVLDNIMIGEVWVCSGQSNMEWSSNQNLKQIVDELPNSSNKNIRLFHIPKTTAGSATGQCSRRMESLFARIIERIQCCRLFFWQKITA